MALVDISTYGVQSNSGADETARINAAIVQARADGNDLRFDIGSYRISGDIQLEDGVSLQGSTTGLTRVFSDPASTAAELNNEGGNRAAITDLEIADLVLDNVVIDLSNRVSAATVRDNIIHNSDAQVQIAFNGGTFLAEGNILLREEPWNNGSGVHHSPSRGISLYKTVDTEITGNIIGGLTRNGENSTVYTAALRARMEAFANANPDIDLYDSGHYTTNIKIPNQNTEVTIDRNMIVGAPENDFDRDHAIYAGGYEGLDVVSNYFAGFYNDASGGVKLRNGEDTYVYNNYFDDISLITYTYDNHARAGFEDTYIFNNTFQIKSGAGLSDEKDPIYYIERNDLRPDDPVLTLKNYNVYNNLIDAPRLRDVLVSVERQPGETIGTEVHVFANTDTTHSILEIEAIAVTGPTKTPFPGLVDRTIDAAEIARMDGLAATTLHVLIDGAPVFSGLDARFDYVEGRGRVSLDTDAIVSDSDYDGDNGGAGNYDGAVLSLRRFSEYNDTNAHDIFGFGEMANVVKSNGNLLFGGKAIASYTQTDGVLSITFTSADGAIPTTALVNQILQSLIYLNRDQTRPEGNDFDFPAYYTFSDGSNEAHGAVRINLVATDSNDIFNGTDGRDTIDAGIGNDTVRGFEGNDRLNGEAGNDVVFSGGGNDRSYGGNGNDFIKGEGGDDTVHGGGADDDLRGNDGDDLVDGGTGNDTVGGNDGDDTVNGGAGDDRVLGHDGTDTLSGGDGNDTAYGGNGDDRIDGNDGADFLDGDDGDDTINGGTGHDTVRGDVGDDAVSGNDGDDTILGNDGNDTLTGGKGNDRILGDVGRDVISGGDGNDTVYGGGWSDLITGDAGADFLNGDAGNDTIFGGSESDTLRGGDHGDVLFGGDGDDQVQGGAGDDYLDGDAGDDTLSGEDGHDVLTDLRGDNRLRGGIGNDVLVSGTGDDRAEGDAGDDLIRVGDGANVVYGGDGDDHILMGDGDDFAHGGSGDDVMLSDRGNDDMRGGSDDDVLRTGAGSDSLYGGAGNDLLDSGTGNDSVTGGDGDDTLLAGDGADKLYGGVGDDSLEGGGNDDALRGEEGDDILRGQGGNDYIDAGDGDNVAFGGAGDDQIIGGTGRDGLVGGTGNDTLFGGAGFDILMGNAGIDRLNGGDGDDQMTGGADADVLKGDGGRDIMEGGGGADFMEGGTGDDYMIGGDGNDVMNGDAGNDYMIGGIGAGALNGGADDDTILGGTGDDTILGGTGADVFVIGNAAGHGIDRVNDFSIAQGDRIVLSGFGVTSTAQFDTFWWNGSVTIIDVNGTGQIRVSGDNMTAVSNPDALFSFAGANAAPVLGGSSNILLAENTIQQRPAQMIANVTLSDSDTGRFAGSRIDIVTGGDISETHRFDLSGTPVSGYYIDDTAAILLNGDAVGRVVPAEGLTGIQLQVSAPLVAAQIEALIEAVTISVNTDTAVPVRNFAITLSELDGTASNRIIARVTIADQNDAPVVGPDRLWDVVANEGRTLSVNIAATHGFVDPDGDALAFLARQVDGAILPDWMSFDGSVLTANPGDYDSGVYQIRVRAYDGNGGVATDSFRLTVGNTSHATMDIDRMTGTDADNVIHGLGGADRLFGFGGDNLIYGGNESGRGDLIAGGTGDDTILGEGGNDRVFGQEGNDSILGGTGNDRLVGNDGDDTLRGDAGADRLFGHDGDDYIEGGDANDYMKAGNGNDTMVGGNGGDLLVGDAGRDVLRGDTGADRLFGGTGSDTLLGGDDNDRLSAFDQDDLLNGQNGNDQLFGGLGNDTLLGGDGYDYLKGGDGDDTIDGGLLSDRLYGGTGADTFVFAENWGSDRIHDWSEEDMIDLRALGLKTGSQTDAQAFRKLEFIQSGSSAVIWIDSDSDNAILMDKTTAASLNMDDFLF